MTGRLQTRRRANNERVAYDPQGMTEPEAHIRDNVIYLTKTLVAWMEKTWGSPLSHVRVATDETSGEVAVVKADGSEPDSVLVHSLRGIGWAEFSFWRPLHQLNLKISPRLQFEIRPGTRQLANGKLAFIFAVGEARVVPRNRREVELITTSARAALADAAATAAPHA